MTGLLLGTISLFVQAFVGPFVGAAEPLILPLPQNIDYATYMRGQLLGADFSTDLRQGVHPQVVAAGSGLEAFIINYEPCVLVGDVIAYRLVVRNLGETELNGVTAQFRYPAQALEFKEARDWPAGASVPGGDGVVTWNIGTILPGPENGQELNVTFVAIAPVGGVATELTVGGGSALVLTGHTIPNNCPAATLETGQPLSEKKPAIVCDPGEVGCTPSLPTLGTLFKKAVTEPARQPVLCSPNDPDGCARNVPQLGARFAEAVASVLPGECSVVEDAIFATPEFQDGLLRRADVAAFFMRPLYDSGQDWSRLVLENELLGINNSLEAKSVLRAIHTKHWQRRIEPLQNVLRGAVSTNTIRALINKWNLDWVTETREVQQGLAERYGQMQTVRQQKFDPVATQAVTNALSSIERACGAALPPPQEKDAGLRRLLFQLPTSVKNQYVRTLQERTQAYQTTQQLFVDPNNPLFPEANRATTWQRDLRDALDAFDAGNKEPLERFIAQIPLKDQGGFAVAWSLTYERHAQADVAADDSVRLSRWEPALDLPKTVAAACARDTTLAARVEVSWCESGLYPSNYILPEARDVPTIRDAVPPDLVPGGENAVIDVQRTVGVSCRGLSGDPFWADDCSCNCNQLIAGAEEGNIKFCQVEKPLQGQPPIKPIIRPDMYSMALAPRTQDECLHEVRLDDHFLSR